MKHSPLVRTGLTLPLSNNMRPCFQMIKNRHKLIFCERLVIETDVHNIIVYLILDSQNKHEMFWKQQISFC